MPEEKRGRFRVDSEGKLVPVLKTPDEIVETYRPLPPEIIGPTRVGEYLLIDLRLAHLIPKDSKLFAVCEELTQKGACGVIESTLVIDFLETTTEGRAVLLDKSNWPKPGGPDDTDEPGGTK